MQIQESCVDEFNYFFFWAFQCASLRQISDLVAMSLASFFFWHFSALSSGEFIDVVAMSVASFVFWEFQCASLMHIQ